MQIHELRAKVVQASDDASVRIRAQFLSLRIMRVSLTTYIHFFGVNSR